MPEGHTIHRAAIDHHKVLAGHKPTIQSPQGRFAEDLVIYRGSYVPPLRPSASTLFTDFKLVIHSIYISACLERFANMHCLSKNRAELYEFV